MVKLVFCSSLAATTAADAATRAEAAAQRGLPGGSTEFKSVDGEELQPPETAPRQAPLTASNLREHTKSQRGLSPPTGVPNKDEQ